MTANDNHNSVIEQLREKTEEVDLKQYLKSTLGGYTKKSVLAYLAILKRQQQDAADTFSRNLKALYEEKENLKAGNQALGEKLLKEESKYKNLYNSLLVPDLEKRDFSEEDFTELKKALAAKENEVERLYGENDRLKKEISSMGEKIESLTAENERSKLETQTQKELLIREKDEGKQLRKQIIELTDRIEENRCEIKLLKSTVSQANIAELQQNIVFLTAQAAIQAELIESGNAQNQLKEQTIEKLTEETKAFTQETKRLTSLVESLNMQNERLTSADTELRNMLEIEYKNKVALIGEKNDLLIDKLAAEKKLDESHRIISTLELQISQLKKAANPLKESAE